MWGFGKEITMRDEIPKMQEGAWFIFLKEASYEDYYSTIYHACQDERLPPEFEEEMWVRACVYPNLDDGVCWRCNEPVPISISGTWYLHNFDALQKLEPHRSGPRKAREVYLLDVRMRATYRALKLGQDTVEAEDIMDTYWEAVKEVE